MHLKRIIPLLLTLFFIFTGFPLVADDLLVAETESAVTELGEMPVVGYYAASPALPEGILIRIVNLANGRVTTAVVLTYSGDYTAPLMLSTVTAEALGIPAGLTVPVRIFIIENQGLDADSIDLSFFTPDAGDIAESESSDPTEAEPDSEELEEFAAADLEALEPEDEQVVHEEDEETSAASSDGEATVAVEPEQPRLVEESQPAEDLATAESDEEGLVEHEDAEVSSPDEVIDPESHADPVDERGDSRPAEVVESREEGIVEDPVEKEIEEVVEASVVEEELVEEVSPPVQEIPPETTETTETTEMADAGEAPAEAAPPVSAEEPAESEESTATEAQPAAEPAKRIRLPMRRKKRISPSDYEGMLAVPEVEDEVKSVEVDSPSIEPPRADLESDASEDEIPAPLSVADLPPVRQVYRPIDLSRTVPQKVLQRAEELPVEEKSTQEESLPAESGVEPDQVPVAVAESQSTGEQTVEDAAETPVEEEIYIEETYLAEAEEPVVDIESEVIPESAIEPELEVESDIAELPQLSDLSARPLDQPSLAEPELRMPEPDLPQEAKEPVVQVEMDGEVYDLERAPEVIEESGLYTIVSDEAVKPQQFETRFGDLTGLASLPDPELTEEMMSYEREEEPAEDEALIYDLYTPSMPENAVAVSDYPEVEIPALVSGSAVEGEIQQLEEIALLPEILEDGEPELFVEDKTPVLAGVESGPEEPTDSGSEPVDSVETSVDPELPVEELAQSDAVDEKSDEPVEEVPITEIVAEVIEDAPEEPVKSDEDEMEAVAEVVVVDAQEAPQEEVPSVVEGDPSGLEQLVVEAEEVAEPDVSGPVEEPAETPAAVVVVPEAKTTPANVLLRSGLYMQVGVYRRLDNANSMAGRFAGGLGNVVQVYPDSEGLFKVLIGPLLPDERGLVLNYTRSMGVGGFFLTVAE